MGVTVVTSGGDVTVATSQKVIAAEDVTVQNSDLSYNQSVAAGATLALPDITITKNDDTTTTYPSAKDIDLGVVDPFPITWDEMAAFYGRGYHYSFSSSDTIYRTGDDAWVDQNVFTADRVADTKKIYNSLVAGSWNTLVNNNEFGNTNRFTDASGVLTSGTGSYFIDHLTGLGWSLPHGSSKAWNTAIDAALGTDFGGVNTTDSYTDWFLPSITQLNSFANPYTSGSWNFAPLNLNTGGVLYSMSSTTKLPATTAYQGLVLTNSGYQVTALLKTTVSASYLVSYCRKHY